MARLLEAITKLLLPRPPDRTTTREVSRISERVETNTKERLADAYELTAADKEDLSERIAQLHGSPEENEKVNHLVRKYREEARLRREEMRRLLRDLEDRRC